MLEKIIDGLDLNSRYTRSISVERDLHDGAAVVAHMPTPNTIQALKHVGAALAAGHAQRAWKVVGPYGSGKSAYGILLAQMLAGPKAFPETQALVSKVAPAVAGHFASSKRLTVPLVGARISIGLALASATRQAIDAWGSKGAALRRNLGEAGLYKGQPVNAVAGELARDLADAAARLGYDGVLLLIDEMGKFVEHAALQPDDGDLIALQQLAEAACRPDDPSLAVVVLQHQQFASYAAGVGRVIGDEWHKVSSRFEEIPFDEPVERYVQFAAHALNLKRAVVEYPGIARVAREIFDAAVSHGMLRAKSVGDEQLFKHPEKLYPLHPLSIAVLAVISKRHGQSERSFHAFLSGHEASGLRDFAERTSIEGLPWYRLPQVFDYLATGYGLRFRDLSAERRWAFAVASVERHAGEAEVAATLKALAVLELVQHSMQMRISPELIAFALGDTEVPALRKQLDQLVEQGVLVRRRNQSEYGFALSDAVNIEALYEHAARRGEDELLIRGANDALRQRAVVANRHYDATGTIRTVAITVGSMQSWPQARVSKDGEVRPDGWIKLVIVPAGAKYEHAILGRIREESDETSLFACVTVSVQGRAALAEHAIWLAVQREVSSKRLDPWTSQYVSQRVQHAREEVDKLVLAALTPSPGCTGQTYWHRGKPVPRGEELNLSQVASWLFDTLFDEAPRIVNELINKERPASAIVLARQRLLDALLAGPRGGPLFRADEYPPEKLIHATLLRDTGIWQEEDKGWQLLPPRPKSRVNIAPIWTAISFQLGAAEAPSFAHVLEALARPPLGVRAGPASVWVVLYLMIHRTRCAVFERGTLVLELTSEVLQRMYKNPQTFQLRELAMAQGSRGLLRDYASALSAIGTVVDGEATHIEIARAMYRWFMRLSDFAQQTGRVSKDATLVRSILRKAQDPIHLLTSSLPQAHVQAKSSASFAEWLSAALSDLGMSQRRLQDLVALELNQALQIAGPIGAIRSQIQAECAGTAGGLADAKLKSFIVRCTDLTLTDEKWLDSISSLLVQRPLDAWTDDTIALFSQALTEISGQYRRWMRLVAQRGTAPRAAERFVGLTLTSPGGQESSLFVATTDASKRLASSIIELIGKGATGDPKLAAAALAQALQELQLVQPTSSQAEGGPSGRREAS
jgi:hypothetical protein